MINRAEVLVHAERYPEALNLAQAASKLVSPMGAARLDGYIFNIIGECLVKLDRKDEAAAAFHKKRCRLGGCESRGG